MRRAGFTLIELIIYIAITAMVVVALTHVMIAILEAREKTEQVGELQHSLRFVTDRIVERSLSAEDIDAKASKFTSDTGILALQMADPAENPTIFSISAGRIVLKKGKQTPQPLTPDNIRIDILRFVRLDPARIRITMTGIDPRVGTGSSATMTLQTSVSLRP